MPYIKQEIADQIYDGTKDPNTAGELTYTITMDLQRYLASRIGGYHYEQLAVCLGALEGAKADLIRRVITPYEELAQATNGDVWDILHDEKGP